MSLDEIDFTLYLITNKNLNIRIGQSDLVYSSIYSQFKIFKTLLDNLDSDIIDQSFSNVVRQGKLDFIKYHYTKLSETDLNIERFHVFSGFISGPSSTIPILEFLVSNGFILHDQPWEKLFQNSYYYNMEHVDLIKYLISQKVDLFYILDYAIDFGVCEIINLICHKKPLG
jgi:hypothetical protein